MSIWWSEDEEDEYDAEPLKYRAEEIIDLARKVGFRDQDLDMVRKLVDKESSFISNNLNPKDSEQMAYGLMQIRENNIYGEDGLIKRGIINSAEDLADPEINLIAALWVANHESWGGEHKIKNDPRPFGMWADWRGTIEKSFDFFEEALAQSEGSVIDIVDDSISNEEEVDPNRLEDPWNLDLNSNSGFDQNVLRFINDSNGEVQPLMGRMDPADYKHLHQQLSKSDPELATELGDMANTPMTNGKAAMLHYPNSSHWAVQNAGRYGLRLREGFDHVVEPVGERLKQGPTDFSKMTEADKVRHFMEMVSGTMIYRDPPVDTSGPGASVGAATGPLRRAQEAGR